MTKSQKQPRKQCASTFSWFFHFNMILFIKWCEALFLIPSFSGSWCKMTPFAEKRTTNVRFQKWDNDADTFGNVKFAPSGTSSELSESSIGFEIGSQMPAACLRSSSKKIDSLMKIFKYFFKFRSWLFWDGPWQFRCWKNLFSDAGKWKNQWKIIKREIDNENDKISIKQPRKQCASTFSWFFHLNMILVIKWCEALFLIPPFSGSWCKMPPHTESGKKMAPFSNWTIKQAPFLKIIFPRSRTS